MGKAGTWKRKKDTPKSGAETSSSLLTWGIPVLSAVVICAAAAAVASHRQTHQESENPIGPAVVEQQNYVLKLRHRLEAHDDPSTRSSLAHSLNTLHRMPSYKQIGNLTISVHQYGTERLLGDATTITGYQKGMLLHGQPVQVLDAPSMQLPAPGVDGYWAAYNPSVVPINWGGIGALLVTYRLSTWNLCTWAAAGSPLERLPVVNGKQRTTSKVAAAVFYEDFRFALSLHEIEGMDHAAHHCSHHTGMVRMGLDDGRLFLIAGEPWLIYAAVAPKGRTKYCFHNMMLCPLDVPSASTGKVRCKQTIPVRFDLADKISEQHRAAGRMPNVHQKNWIPFVDESRLYLVFTIEPLVVVHVDLTTGKCTEVSQAGTPAMRVFHGDARESQHSTLGVHGGSPLIPLPAPNDHEFLGIGRVARGNIQYALFFFTVASSSSNDRAEEAGVSTGWQVERVSPIFCFSSTSPHHRGLCETIQFAGGMVLADDKRNLLVTYGTNDCESKVAFLTMARVLELLQPARGALGGRSRRT